ncbi:MAG: hypothetical protein EZS28_034116 [Streblomastix strix]|uniref:C3H1-type domain-containing protein n=1 Tax=Streblomastix strix TaxID=222440 RepID=A0A5J4UI25_9EUKA|nr:MAG: hypothetical protein EZS28_034116 [Streblomastix strix]
MYPPMIPIDPRQLQYPSSQPQQQGQQTGQQYSTGSNQIPISPIAPIPSPYIHPLQQIPPIGYPPPIQGINQYQQGIQNPLPVPTQSLTNPYDPNYNQYNSQQTPDHDSSQIQKDENQKKLTRKEFEKEFIDENANLDSSFASSNKRLRLDNNIDGQGLFEQIFANAGYVNNYDENEESNGYFQQEKEQTSSLNESGVINWPAPCHYHPNCKNLACPFIHAPPCKNDKACTNPQCTFAHYTNLNSRPLCPYRTRCTKTNCTYRHLQPNQKNPFQSGRSLYFSDEAINSMASKKDSTSTVTQQEPEQQSITQDSFSNEKQQVSDKVETCQVNVENADQQSLHSNSKPPDELQTDNI